MVLREAIPAGLARTHAARVAIGGMSMGGFGRGHDTAYWRAHVKTYLRFYARACG